MAKWGLFRRSIASPRALRPRIFATMFSLAFYWPLRTTILHVSCRGNPIVIHPAIHIICFSLFTVWIKTRWHIPKTLRPLWHSIWVGVRRHWEIRCLPSSESTP